MIKRTISAVLLASIVLLAIAASAGAQTQPIAAQQQYGDQGQQYQEGSQAGSQQLSIPPAPPKLQPDAQYGSTSRASIIGEKLSKASQGNAMVYVAENANNTITVNVDLKKDADGNQLAPVLANLTYALSDVYAVTDRANNDIFLNVFDTAKNQIINAKFSADKNAFEYFNVAESSRQAQPAQGGQQQPAYGQQPGYGGQQQPGYGGQQQPAYGGQQGYM
jgi:hypothetical protein